MAKGSNGLNLPGNFNSYPKGPKPAKTAPHAQPTIEARTAARGPRHNMESRPKADPAPRHNMEQRPKADPAPRHNMQSRPLPARAPRHNIQEAPPAPRTPRHSIKAGNPNDNDPFGNYYFKLEVNGQEIGLFQECSGLKNASEVFEIAEGGLNGNVHKRPGQSKWENIILKYASSASTSLLQWRDQFMQDQFGSYRTGSISVMNNRGEVVRKFEFTGGWPVSWEGPTLSSMSSDLSVETLEIAFATLKVVTS